jgi:Fe-S cluster assembly ATP-binding protein
MLEIKNLKASVESKEILKGLTLSVKPGEVHAIMGPNGSGKSSLSKILAGHPSYQITEGQILFEVNFEHKNLLEMKPDIRAKEGVFLAYQYPIEVPGVSNFTFLFESFNAITGYHGAAPMSEEKFRKFILEKMKLLSMSPSFLDRPVNVGFSDGSSFS